MRSTGRLLTLALLLLTAGCTTVPAAPEFVPPAGSSVCNAAAASWAIGERAQPDVIERATTAARARTARVIRPGEAVTMEFNAERLTVEVDGQGHIADIRCG